jgi:LPXTG-motif cell wall-anchored protein
VTTMRSRLRLPLIATVTVGCLAVGAPAMAAIVDAPLNVAGSGAAFRLLPTGTYETGVFDESAAEIVTYYAAAQRLLVVNAAEATVEVLSLADPAAPTKLFDLETTGVPSSDGTVVPEGAVANSVAVRADGLGAVAVESDVKTDDGWVVFFDADADGAALGAVRVGALPDSLVFSPDGSRIVVANEGEPAEDYSVDPEGSVSVIDVPAGLTLPAQTAVRSAGFRAFEAGGTLPLEEGVRVFGGREDAGTGTPGFPVSENLEPEYPTVSADSGTAWVTLQEANAIAEVDLDSAAVTAVHALETVDRMTVPFDASDRDGAVDAEGEAGGAIAIRTWPVLGFAMPDTIDSYETAGSTYLVTANEGDSRDWEGYSEVSRVADLAEDGRGPVCDTAFDGYYGVDGLPADTAGFLSDAALGRLNVTTADGFDEEAGCYERLYTFGSRSFSIRDTSGAVVWDSADALEKLTAVAPYPYFNSNHTSSGLDERSDDKGPEPEGVTIGEVAGRTYAFVGLERIGGIVAFDITVPTAATFVAYANNRDFSVSAEDDGLAGAGDLGPEGLTFVSAEESPSGVPLVVVGNEVSGSTTVYSLALAAVPEPAPSTTPTPDPTPTGGTAPTPAPSASAVVVPAATVSPAPSSPRPSSAPRPRPTSGALASTGTDTAEWALGLGGMLTAGGLVLLAVRRRSSRRS